MIIDKKEKNKLFYKTMLSIAVPVTLQNLISSSLNMIDIFMITKLGDANIAAVGQANQVFFLFAIILFGISSGSSIFIAQFWGKRDRESIKSVLGIAIFSGVIISAAFTLASLIAPEQIMKILINDPEVIALGAKYLRIVCVSYVFTAVTFAFSGACRSVRQASIPLFVSVISILINTFLNYALIFGKFGLPELRIEGAALATVIARVIEALLLVAIIYKGKGQNVLRAKWSELTNISMKFVKRFFKTSSPVIVNEFMWSLGMVMYTIAYASLGKESSAAAQIAVTIQNIFMVFAFGLAGACATMIGNKIGEGDEEEGRRYAKRFAIIGIILGITLAVLLYFTAPIILKIFSGDPALFETSRSILRILAFFIPFKLFTAVVMVGIFRGGGDTKYSMILETGCVWMVGVPLAFIGALVFKLPVQYVVALAYSEEIVKSLLSIPRVVSGKWMKNIVDD